MLEKYWNTIALKEIGEEGQKKLFASKVLVVGAGGLASSLLTHLVSSGVGHIGVVDDDIVKKDNLPRQIIFSEEDVSKKKVEVVKEKLSKLNSDVLITAYDTRLSKDNAEEIIARYDLIIDCVDNFESKFLINDTCVKLNKPFVTAGVSDYCGQIMSYIPGKSRDFKSIFDELPLNINPEDFDDDGVFPTTVGVISNIEATEVLKILLGIGEPLINEMLVVDTLNWNIKKIQIKNPS